MWEQSLVIRTFFTVLVAGGERLGFAMSYCSNSFRFDQLCPDPRFGSRETGVSGGGGVSSTTRHLPTDTNIYLNTVDTTYSYNSPTNRYGGRSYTSSMSVKDPSKTSCDFYRNGLEIAEVTAVHVTEKPWNFRHANHCSHIVKFTYDLFNSSTAGGVVGGGGGGSSNPAQRQSICHNEFSFRRQGSQDVNHRKDKHQTEQQAPRRRQPDHDEETAKKMNVYFWHNFTIFPHFAEFVDTITNHHWSREDISCVKETRSAKYVQIVVTVSKSGQCEIILQEYKLDEKRSPFGCSDAIKKDPIPRQFCGSYDCSQSIVISASLKLHSKRISDLGETSWNSPGGGGGGSKSAVERVGSSYHQQKNNPSGHSSSSSSNQYENGEGTHTYPDYEEGGMGSAGGGPPCVTEITDTTTTPGLVLGPQTQQHHPGPDSSEEEEKKEEPMNWMEAAFLMAFPLGGVVFIVVVLNILRTQSAREICRGYTYPRPRQYQNQGIPIGSFTSIDKNGLPI